MDYWITLKEKEEVAKSCLYKPVTSHISYILYVLLKGSILTGKTIKINESFKLQITNFLKVLILILAMQSVHLPQNTSTWILF